MKTYGNTKLMNVLFANELTKRFKDTGVVSTSLHPGFVATDFLRDLPKWLDPVKAAFLGAFARNEFEGAKTQILAATAPEYESVGGIYFDSCKPKKPLAAALNETLASLFWEASEEYVKDFAFVEAAEE
jgi:NAD(P)-dependent dehydrogenase (short-subunit alcohol dehydrogenase family)